MTTVRKQPPKDVLKKRCSENMQQIYRKAPMPKRDCNKVVLQLYSSHTSAWVFSSKFSAYFHITFSKNTFGWLLLYAQSSFSIITRHIYNKFLKDRLQLRILRTWIKICANSFINTSLNIMKQNSTKVLGNLSLKKKYDPTFQRTLHQDT